MCLVTQKMSHIFCDNWQHFIDVVIIVINPIYSFKIVLLVILTLDHPVDYKIAKTFIYYKRCVAIIFILYRLIYHTTELLYYHLFIPVKMENSWTLLNIVNQQVHINNLYNSDWLHLNHCLHFCGYTVLIFIIRTDISINLWNNSSKQHGYTVH